MNDYQKNKYNVPQQIKNKYGLILFYKIDVENRFLLLDSNKNYFNDFVLRDENINEEIDYIVKLCEKITIQELCMFYDYKLFTNIQYLLDYVNADNVCDIQTQKSILNNEYLNIILDNNKKTFYCWKE